MAHSSETAVYNTKAYADVRVCTLLSRMENWGLLVLSAAMGGISIEPGSDAEEPQVMRNEYRLLIYVACILLCLFAALIPVRSLQAPKWDVEVVDKSGNPVSGISVRESYQNYSAELTGHEETGITEVNGQVHFDAKVLRASLLKRFVAVIHSAMAGVHASFGPHAFVFAFGSGMEGDWVDSRGYVGDWTGSPSSISTRIIVHPSIN